MGNICRYVMNNLLGSSLAKDGLCVCNFPFLQTFISTASCFLFSHKTFLMKIMTETVQIFKSKNLQNLDTQTSLGKLPAQNNPW